MNRRLFLVILGVGLGCGVLAPMIALRAHRARAIEAAMTHAVVLHRHLAGRTADWFADGARADLDLTPWATEPGLQAVWVVDATGRLIAQRGVVTPAEVAIAQQAIAQPEMVVRGATDDAVWLAQSVPPRAMAQTSSPLGAVGCRFAPLAAVRAVGNPWGLFSYLLAIATAGIIALLVLWYQALHGSAEHAREATVPVFPAPPVAMGHDLSWAQAVVDVLPLPAMVLDATHRLAAANGAVLTASRAQGLHRGMHWLDLVTAMGWNPAAHGWVQALERTPQRTQHCAGGEVDDTPHANLVRLEQAGTIVGYWISFEGALHDPAAG